MDIEVPGKVEFDNIVIGDRLRLMISNGKLKILFGSNEGISLHGFENMLAALESDEAGICATEIKGAGIYYQTKDPREGPFVNHKFQMVKLASTELLNGRIFYIRCTGDYSESSFDEYWYNGPKSGKYEIKIEFELDSKKCITKVST